ncbi:uncharacterized protein N7511_002603 [Penicillium nucicola]|uniref:uncharacterized protein n=1 Tax=Penicillium nucicola TaxID=1850975 RepID=UPI00254521C1|nr:uncharacterized protein N7511_002603 [Penicillium nucicola]KAJ5770552.1 hypothetical protein N7511_002603 [Penicillium nucicola]
MMPSNPKSHRNKKYKKKSAMMASSKKPAGQREYLRSLASQISCRAPVGTCLQLFFRSLLTTLTI